MRSGWLWGAAAVSLAACAGVSAGWVDPAPGGAPGAAGRPLRVVVTIPPLRGLVEPLARGAGITETVEVLIPPGVSEHGYEIPPAQIARLAKADVVIEIGRGLEPQVDKVLAGWRGIPPRVVVMASVELEGAGTDKDQHATGEHGGHDSQDGHAHGSDPHMWLDPLLVEKLVRVVARTLREAAAVDSDAAMKARFDAAEAALEARVREMHERYTRMLAAVPAERRVIVVGHDAWGYLARRYGLRTVAVKGLAAGEPTPAAIDEAVRAIREQGATCVFVEPQLGQGAGRRVAAAAGVPVRTLDPLGNGDWFEMMDGNLRELAAAMGVAVDGKGGAPVRRSIPTEPGERPSK